MKQLPLLVALCVFGQLVIANDHNSLLAIDSSGKWMLVGNQDNKSVSVVDLSENKVTHEIAVQGTMEGVALVPNTTLAVVTLYFDDQLALIDYAAGKVVMTTKCADEPYGVMVSKDGKSAFVTHEYPGQIAEYALPDLKLIRTLDVAPYLRGLTFSTDQSKLLTTSWFSAEIISVDRATGKIVDRWKGGSTDNLVRSLVVHPSAPFAFFPMIRSKVERALGNGSIFPYVGVAETTATDDAKKRRRTVVSMDAFIGNLVTANPWEVAITPDGKTLFALFSGTNDMMVARVLADGYRHLEAIRRVRVGSFPRGIAVHPSGQSVYVLNQLDATVTQFDTEKLRLMTTITTCKLALSPTMKRGKQLFNIAEDPMTYPRWISCSSCHPDGDHDGRIWQQAEGLRRTTAFFGMEKTYPLHWSADRDELQDFEHTIRGPLMQGRGLIRGEVNEALGKANAGRSTDLDALAEYCNSFKHTLSPHAAGPGKLSESAERGKAIFFATKTKCAECHTGSEYTDCKMHDVGTKVDDTTEKLGPMYDTPTLLRVYRAPSYLHHGKAATLHEVFTKFNPKDQHGVTSHLKPGELDDLVAFLKSLPYDLNNSKSN